MAATVLGLKLPTPLFAGTATLASGTVTITDPRIKTGMKVQVFYDTQASLTNPGSLNVTTLTNATSFVITSSNGSDANNVVFVVWDAL